MSKQINIGGRLHSTEQGNVITGANEVLDDTKGKKQNVINADVDAELIRLDQSKQNNLTFDNTPTENSNNPVKSSGVYAADKALSDAIEAILILIPSAATALNQLADKNFVNSSIATDTATFRGTSETGLSEAQFLEWANGLTHDMNDYVFWQTIDEAGNTLFKRYKWNGTQWLYEYTLNNSSFTADQWAAIMSGITTALVGKLRDLPTAAQLITSFEGKQDVLTFDNVPTQGSANPVKSGGVFSAIKDVTDLIPAEATNLNQLADKAYVLAQIVAATPAFKGQFETLAELLAVLSPKDGDLGIVRTKDGDGYDVFTFYQYLNNDWDVFYILSHHLLNKPATTGTTGAYPYNGMGRVVIPKKMVNGVNTLTHEAFEDSEGNDRENTIYVIKYDFTLGGSVNVPANCVLEFDGGSISGNGTNRNTITGQETTINAGKVTIFKNAILSGSWKNKELFVSWFGLKTGTDYSTANTTALNSYMVPSCVNTSLSLCVDIAIHINGSFTVTNFDLICQRRIYYTGAQTLDGAVIDIENSWIRNHVIDVENLSTEGTYNTRKDYPIEGVRINNLADSNIHIECVSKFTTGVVVMSSVGSQGNFGNNYYLNYIRNSYKNLVLKRTNNGWVNENLFIGGRLQNDSEDVFFGHNTAISFINGNQASNVSFNNDVFIKPDIEDAYIGIYAGTKVIVEDSKFISVRNENVTTLINDDGVFQDFARKAVISVYREGNQQGRMYNTFRVEGYVGQMREYSISLQGISTGNIVSCYKGSHFAYKGATGKEGLYVGNNISANSIIDAKYVNFGGSGNGIGYLFKKTENSLNALINVYGKAGEETDCVVWLLDEDLHITNTDGVVTNADKSSVGFFYISSYTMPDSGWKDYYFQMKNIPSNVKYIAIVPIQVTSGSHLYIDSSHELVQFENELVGDSTSVLLGMTDDAEYAIKRVISCFDTTNGKLLWRNNGTWVDATGNQV